MSNPHVNQLGMGHIMGSMTDSPAPKKRGRPKKTQKKNDSLAYDLISLRDRYLNELRQAGVTKEYSMGKSGFLEISEDHTKLGRPRKYPLPEEKHMDTHNLPNRLILSSREMNKEAEEFFNRNPLLDVVKQEYERQRTTRDEAQAKMDYLDGLVAQCPEMQLNK